MMISTDKIRQMRSQHIMKLCLWGQEITQFEKQKSDFIIDLGINKIEIHNSTAEPLKVTLVDTGDDTMTDCRILSKLMAGSLC